MTLRRDPKHLSKLLAYMLGRQPDEFGLVPDGDGFIKVKELLQVISEEDGWRYVRRQHLAEILLTVPDPAIEIKTDTIRAKNRTQLPRPTPAQNLPKLLFTCVRRKAHAVVLEKGVFPMGHSRVVLSSSSDMAVRMGKRKDPMPVLLTVIVPKMLDRGSVFHQLGQTLFLTETVPFDCFTSPPVAKQRPKPLKEAIVAEIYPHKSAGTFLLDLPGPKPPGPHFRDKQRKKDIAWKKDRKNQKKRKDKMWPDL
ncbi:MAG: RNA 2'-phosphotransferase [Desulfobacterales bacterium]|nr:RNA 2'-phosphotransferase [Desulfobacterales bacterium]